MHKKKKRTSNERDGRGGGVNAPNGFLFSFMCVELFAFYAEESKSINIRISVVLLPFHLEYIFTE